MLETVRKKGLLDAMLKHAIFFALFFPFFTSQIGMPYAPDIMLVNGFVGLFLLGAVLRRALQRPQKETALCVVVLALLLLLNVFLSYTNLTTSRPWYFGQLNITLPFVLFLALLSLKADALEDAQSVVRFLVQAAVLSVALGFVLYAMGYMEVRLMYGRIEIVPMDVQAYGERRFHWIYYHKSQYALMLILFIGLMVSNQNVFKTQWTYLASIGVMLIGLVISHTYTAIAASLLIFAGMALDALRKRFGRFPRKLLWLLIPLVAVLAVLLYIIGRERDLLTLGSRVPIWRECIKFLKQNFWGIGQKAGYSGIPAAVFENGYVNNCHNVFLNWMLQYSIPGGACLTAMFVTICAAALRRNRCFTALGILLALLVPMMMDWSVLSSDMPMLMLGLYFIFFCPAARLQNSLNNKGA